LELKKLNIIFKVILKIILNRKKIELKIAYEIFIIMNHKNKNTNKKRKLDKKIINLFKKFNSNFNNFVINKDKKKTKDSIIKAV